jgi:hypothetical protein
VCNLGFHFKVRSQTRVGTKLLKKILKHKTNYAIENCRNLFKVLYNLYYSTTSTTPSWMEWAGHVISISIYINKVMDGNSQERSPFWTLPSVHYSSETRPCIP